MIEEELNNAPIDDGTEEKQDKGKLKNQYHPAFCAAMELELREDRDHLTFDDEYNLNTKPNEIDFVVINDNENTGVKSGLGAIFRKHNIFEFKSFHDSLNERVYHRTMGYMHLYIAYGDEYISPEDITVSFLREGYPRNLMKYFKEKGFTISTYEDGIYHIRKTGHVDMQVIVTRRLGRPYAWLNKITKRLKPDDLTQIQEEIGRLSEEIDLVNAESVLDMSITLNKDKEFVKEMIGMGALRDMFKEEFEEKDREISALNEQLQSQSEQLQSKDKQLQSKDEQLVKLRKEIEELKKNGLNKIAML